MKNQKQSAAAMHVRYSTKKLEKLASDGKERQKKLGTDGARRFEARISEFKAAGCLEDLAKHVLQMRKKQIFIESGKSQPEDVVGYFKGTQSEA